MPGRRRTFPFPIPRHLFRVTLMTRPTKRSILLSLLLPPPCSSTPPSPSSPQIPPRPSQQTTSRPHPPLPHPPHPPLIPSSPAQRHPPQMSFMPPLSHCTSGPLGSHAQNASPLRPSPTPTQMKIGQRNFVGSSSHRPLPQNPPQI